MNLTLAPMPCGDGKPHLGGRCKSSAKMKLIRPILVACFVAVSVATHAAGESAIEVRSVKPMDSAILEEWKRVTDYEDILGVSASKTNHPKWKWQVFVAVAEFVREEPLESRLVDRITSSLKNVKGVKSVVHDDREVWIIEGDVGGETLVRSVSAALNSLAPQLRKHMESL